MIIVINKGGERMALRNTKQREEVLGVILGINRHMTAEEVHAELLKKNKSVGIATVYRNLNRLVEEKKIQKIMDQDCCYFDGNGKPHYHLRCKNCGKYQDLDMDYQEHLNQVIQEKLEIDILGHHLTFDFICDDCCLK